MFGFLRNKKVKISPVEYRKAVNKALEEDGFETSWLNLLLPGNDLKIDRLYYMLQIEGLEPLDAAKAIEVGTHFFNEKKEEAGKSGWPLKYTDKIPHEYSKEECYYLEMVAESVRLILQKKKKSASSCTGFGGC